MNNNRWLVLTTVALLALGGAFASGYGVSQQRQRIALLQAKQRSDSTMGALRQQIATYRESAVHVDSVVQQWERFADSVLQAAPRVRVVRESTLPPLMMASGVTTTDAPSVVAVTLKARQTVTIVEADRQQCNRLLRDCAVALTDVTNRAERAEADAALLRAADGRRARWRNVTLGVCGGSIAYNAWTVWGRR